ncbi:cytochrome P450 [Earliella scabrosa]|nr:cytochrome P450 [Earliella scabrosa]
MFPVNIQLPAQGGAAYYAAAVLAFVCLWKVVGWLRPKSVVESLPVPPSPHPIWGHEKEVYVNQPGRAFRKWTQDLGLTFRIKAALGARDVLVLSDPGSIAYILQKQIYNYHHSEVVRPRIGRLLGEGLGWVEGEAEHKRMRHLVSPSLSQENVKAMTQDVRLGALQVLEELTQHVQAQKEHGPTDMVHWMAKATLNIVGRVAFLYDFEGGNSEEALHIINSRRRSVSVAKQYAAFFTLMLLRRFPILNKLPISAIQAQGLAKMAVQTGVAHELVRRNKELVHAGGSTMQKDLLSRLLVAQAAGKISREELYEQISTFIISGHETTTQTLAFTIYELSRHPEVQRRLREELEAFHEEPTYDDFANRLPYLDAVLRETLRLYPALPYMERTAMVDDVIPLRNPVRLPNGKVVTEIPVTRGQVVLIPVIAIHRMDSLWKDPDVFRPERWLSDLPPPQDLCSGWANLLAFSDGPRNCVGLRLAIFQYKVILSYLLQRFNFKDANMDIKLKISSSLQAWVDGREDLGPCLPAVLELL